MYICKNNYMKEVIKSELKTLNKVFNYQDIMIALKELISEKAEQGFSRPSDIYTIDLEGDLAFIGTLAECENFIVKSKIPKKRNKKEYGLTTPTEDNIVLCFSNEFSHLF